MTVAQLIEHLKTLPQDVEVIIFHDVDSSSYGEYVSPSINLGSFPETQGKVIIS